MGRIVRRLSRESGGVCDAEVDDDFGEENEKMRRKEVLDGKNEKKETKLLRVNHGKGRNPIVQ